MQFKTILLIFTLLFSIFAAACGDAGTNVNNANSNAVNANIAKTDVNSALETTKKPEKATTNNAPMLTPIVHAYYEALKKKDDAALRNLLSKDFLKSIEADMKEDKRTGLAAHMAEYDTIPEKPVEVRNEKIEGDKADAEIKGGAYANWTPFSFIKENGTWRFTGGSSDLDAMK